MSTDAKLNKAQLPKTIKSGGFLGALVGNFGGPLVKGLYSLMDHKEKIFLVTFQRLNNIEITKYFN